MGGWICRVDLGLLLHVLVSMNSESCFMYPGQFLQKPMLKARRCVPISSSLSIFFFGAIGGEEEGFDLMGSREIKMMPFGAGRRSCPGSGLAVLHLEYFVANLVWKFEWRAVDGVTWTCLRSCGGC
ncbi:hypothetical protein ACFX2J_022140 [Malus domestica]